MYKISIKELWALTHPSIYLNQFLKKGKKNGSHFVLSFDIDLSRDAKNMPKVLSELKKRDLKASFAVVGMQIKKWPEEHIQIVEEGHEILNHTWSHPDSIELSPDKFFDQMTPEEKKEEILICHEAIKDILHYDPKGFRVPHFGNQFTQAIYPILKELNYSFSTSTLCTNTPSYGQPYQAENGIWEMPVLTCPKHPFSSFDSWHCIKRPKTKWKPGALHKKNGEFLLLFRKLLQMLINHNIYGSLYFDPADIAEENDTLLILDYLCEARNSINITTYSELLQDLKHSE